MKVSEETIMLRIFIYTLMWDCDAVMVSALLFCLITAEKLRKSLLPHSLQLRCSHKRFKKIGQSLIIIRRLFIKIHYKDCIKLSLDIWRYWSTSLRFKVELAKFTFHQNKLGDDGRCYLFDHSRQKNCSTFSPAWRYLSVDRDPADLVRRVYSTLYRHSSFFFFTVGTLRRWYIYIYFLPLRAWKYR